MTSRTAGQALLSMLQHEPGGARDFLAVQSPDVAESFVACLQVLQARALAAMTRNPSEFLAFKAPDPQPPVEKEGFQQLVKLYGTGGDSALAEIDTRLSLLSLSELSSLASLCSRARHEWVPPKRMETVLHEAL